MGFLWGRNCRQREESIGSLALFFSKLEGGKGPHTLVYILEMPSHGLPQTEPRAHVAWTHDEGSGMGLLPRPGGHAEGVSLAAEPLWKGLAHSGGSMH